MGRNRHKLKTKKEYSASSIGGRINSELLKKQFHDKLVQTNIDKRKKNTK